MDNIWEVMHKERESLADDLHNLSPEQWNTQSLCDGWSVHDVLAHLVDDAKTTKLSFVSSLIMAGFNFDRVNEKGVQRQRRESPQETLQAFRQVSDRTTSAPAPLASRLVEIIVHAEDIRRPLNISHTYPVASILEAIEYQLATSESMGGSKEKAENLRLISTDADWTHGTGAELHGNAIDILIALTGRPVSQDALTGAGAPTLRQ